MQKIYINKSTLVIIISSLVSLIVTNLMFRVGVLTSEIVLHTLVIASQFGLAYTIAKFLIKCFKASSSYRLKELSYELVLVTLHKMNNTEINSNEIDSYYTEFITTLEKLSTFKCLTKRDRLSVIELVDKVWSENVPVKVTKRYSREYLNNLLITKLA